jgi:hypothetical protein
MKARRKTCCFDPDQDPIPTDLPYGLKISLKLRLRGGRRRLPRDIRQLIERNLGELERYGSLRCRTAKPMLPWSDRKRPWPALPVRHPHAAVCERHVWGTTRSRLGNSAKIPSNNSSLTVHLSA